MTGTWHALLPEADFPAEGRHLAVVAGWHVFVARGDDGLHAVNDRCTHQAAALSGGRVRRGTLMCPLHGARFELASGKCLGAAYPPLRVFPLRVTDGMIEVELPGHPPGMDELPVSM